MKIEKTFPLQSFAACGSMFFLHLALWAASHHLLISPFALTIASMIPLAIGLAFLKYFDHQLPILYAAVGSAASILYATIATEANHFVFALLPILLVALWMTATAKHSPWTSTLMLAAAGAVLGVWGIRWQLDPQYAIASGLCFVAASLAIAILHQRQGHAWSAHAISIGALIFVASGASIFDASAEAFFASTISVALAFGLLASRPSQCIAIVLAVLASLIIYKQFEISIALLVVQTAALFLAHRDRSKALNFIARAPLFASIIVLIVLHPAFEIGSDNTHRWCLFTFLTGAQAFALAQLKHQDQIAAQLIAATALVAAVFTEITFYAGFGLALTIIAAVIGALATTKSRPIGLTLLAFAALKLFAYDWMSLNGPPRVAILIAGAVTMLLFAVRVKTTPHEQHQSPGRR